MRIGVVAPSTPIEPAVAERVGALAAALYPRVELVFHPQCFFSHGHFAGSDVERLAALVEVANDPGFGALWCARGGYGSCRIAEQAIAALAPVARDKAYLGYSDAGFLLAGLYRAGFPHVVQGPMAKDVVRDGGEAAIARVLAWMVKRSPGGLEPSLASGEPAAAFNLTVLSQLLGTALEPDLGGHVLMLEEVSEHMYRIDRTFFHVTSNAAIRRVSGVRLGRVGEVPANDPDFAQSEEEIARFWCARAGIAYLGRADIGHDAANKLVPFGAFSG